jgi:hypothetical protein
LLSFVEPLYALAITPFSLARLVGVCVIHTHAVLLSVAPLAFVAAAVGPREDAVAFLFVVMVIALVGTSIHPREETLSLHLVISPLAIVHAAVLPLIDALALNVIVFEDAFVCGAVRPCKSALSVFLAVLVHASVACIIRPRFVTIAFLLVLDPLAFVSSAVQVGINTHAMCFVLLPVAVVNVTIRMNESALSMSLIIEPVALVGASVRPHLFALALLNFCSFFPLAGVVRSIPNYDHVTLFEFAKGIIKFVLIINESLKLFLGVLDLRVRVIASGRRIHSIPYTLFSVQSDSELSTADETAGPRLQPNHLLKLYTSNFGPCVVLAVRGVAISTARRRSVVKIATVSHFLLFF